jgi:hypothetical protein
LCVVLGLKSRALWASCMISKCSTTALYFQPLQIISIRS